MTRAALLVILVASCSSSVEERTLPLRLSDTGLYADVASKRVALDVVPFEPQYPLWSDGASKQRWIRVPTGTAIDARDPGAWRFPAGTQLWKEFSFERRIETRYMEKLADGSWRRLVFVWDPTELDAQLAPAAGVPDYTKAADGVPYDIPSRADCELCHSSGNEVLGFSALQLSDDRDPMALHVTEFRGDRLGLTELSARGLLQGLPAELIADPPRIAADTPRERAVFGYLHSNCGSCHHTRGLLAPLELDLEARLGVERDEHLDGLLSASGRRLRLGSTGESLLYSRMASRTPAAQMPPLATHRVDQAALDLVEAWIREDLSPIDSPSTHNP